MRIVIAPPEVRAEFASAVRRYERFRGLVFPDWVRVETPRLALSDISPWASLDPGESAAVVLAVEIKADLILIDEASGRAVARRLGLLASGLLEAKDAGLILAVSPVLDELIQRAGFFLSKAEHARILTLAGEAP